MGRRQRWNERGGCLRVERFPDDGNPLFLALVAYGGRFRVVSRHRTLKAAQRAAEAAGRIHSRWKAEPTPPRLAQTALF